MEVLLVEDNIGDQKLVAQAFKASGRQTRLHVVEDGVEAMDFVRRTGKHTTSPSVQLIILDMNLPKKDGRAVLRELKADPILRRIPVVVFTSSKAKEDVAQVLDLHANSYIVKPGELERFYAIMTALEEYWTTIVEAPCGAKGG